MPVIEVGPVSCHDSARKGSFLSVTGLFQTSGSTIAPPALRLSEAVVPFGQSVCGSNPCAIVNVFGVCANATLEITASVMLIARCNFTFDSPSHIQIGPPEGFRCEVVAVARRERDHAALLQYRTRIRRRYQRICILLQ